MEISAKVILTYSADERWMLSKYSGGKQCQTETYAMLSIEAHVLYLFEFVFGLRRERTESVDRVRCSHFRRLNTQNRGRIGAESKLSCQIEYLGAQAT